jgi:hypothetical protein
VTFTFNIPETDEKCELQIIAKSLSKYSEVSNAA